MVSSATSEDPPGMKKVGVVGATGAVGVEMIKVLHTRHFPCSRESLTLFASQRSAGSTVDTPYGPMEVQLFTVDAAREMDVVLMAVSGSFATKFALEIAAPGGPVVIDNSSAFRYTVGVPLVIPEVNPHAIGGARLIANPNCTTAIAAMALWPIHQEYGIRSLVVSTYQAASGAGAEGMQELLDGSKAFLDGETVEGKVFAHRLPFNVIPHIDKFQPNGFTKEEMKVAWETAKIFEEPSIQVSCTAVRCPTLRAHAESICVQTHLPVDLGRVRYLLDNAVGVRLVDDPLSNAYPMPISATGQDDVEVGRLRSSLVFGSRGLELFVCGDQLLRGAALNAVLIAELVGGVGPAGAAGVEAATAVAQPPPKPYRTKLFFARLLSASVAGVVSCGVLLAAFSMGRRGGR